MGRPVKSRSYDSPRRRAQAAETRRLILEAARHLFEHNGYAATIVPAIADEAGVATKTVYLAFETKSKLLRAVWEARLGGNEEATPVVERRWFRDLSAETDPAEKLRLLAAQSRRVKETNGTLLEVIRVAAALDTDVAVLWDDIEAKLLRVQRAVVDQLLACGALRPDVSAREASQALWALNHPTLWQLLVQRQRWTPRQYERWQCEMFCLELLPGERYHR